MQDQISAAVLFLAKLIEKSNSKTNINSEQLELFKQKLSELLNKRFENHWFPEAPNRGQGYRCIRLNKNIRKDTMLENAAKACGMTYEDMKLPIELTIWVDPHEVCCRFGESKGSYCTLASFNDKENQEIHTSDEIFQRASNHLHQYHQQRRPHYNRHRKSSDNSTSSSDEKMNSPLKQKLIQPNTLNNRRQHLNNNNSIKNSKLNNSNKSNKMSISNTINQNQNQYMNQQSWFNMVQPQQQPWIPMSSSPPSSGPRGHFLGQQKWMPSSPSYSYNQSNNYRNNNYFNKPTVKV